jgi:hypothetical protein
MKFLYTFILIFVLQTGIINAQITDIKASDTIINNNAGFSYKEVLFNGDSVNRKIIIDSSILADFWDTVPQLFFWKKIMNLPEDSALINVFNTRQILDEITVNFYKSLDDSAKENYKDSLRVINGLPDSTRILYSTGKKSFYQFRNAISNIDESIPVFIENGVDPWYAQSILLIESPDKLQKSSAGAYGPFQLM